MSSPGPADGAATDRLALWAGILNDRQARTVAELGVFRGAYAEAMLSRCQAIERYYLIDPWRHLEDWNKPANVDDTEFEAYLEEVTQRTEPWADKRVFLRGRTVEVIDQIPDGSLDFAYVDGDHTLRGISIDLLRLWPKMRPGGLIGGDDFARTVWQHKEQFEPTLVFPFAVYFAEAHGVRIEAYPKNQFTIHTEPTGFEFVDHTGRYDDTTLRDALLRRKPGQGASAPAGAAAQPAPTPPPTATKKLLRRLRGS